MGSKEETRLTAIVVFSHLIIKLLSSSSRVILRPDDIIPCKLCFVLSVFYFYLIVLVSQVLEVQWSISFPEGYFCKVKYQYFQAVSQVQYRRKYTKPVHT